MMNTESINAFNNAYTSSHILQTLMPIANPTTNPSNLIHVRRTE